MRFVGAYLVPTDDPDECIDIVEGLIEDDDSAEFAIFSIESGSAFIVVSTKTFKEVAIGESSSVSVPYALNSETIYESEWIDPPVSSLGREILKKIANDISRDTSLESSLSTSSKLHYEKTKQESLDRLPRKSLDALQAAKAALADSGASLSLGKTKAQQKPKEESGKSRTRRPSPLQKKEEKGKARERKRPVESDFSESRKQNLKRHQEDRQETTDILEEFLG